MRAAANGRTGANPCCCQLLMAFGVQSGHMGLGFVIPAGRAFHQSNSSLPHYQQLEWTEGVF